MTQDQVRNLHFTCSTDRTQSYGPDQSLSALSCSQAFRQNLNRIHIPSHKSHKRCNFHSMVLWSTLAISDHKNRIDFVATTVLEGPPLLLVSLEIYCPTSNVSNTNHGWCVSRLLVLLHGILSAQRRTKVYWYTISGLGLQCSLEQAPAAFNYFLHFFYDVALQQLTRNIYSMIFWVFWVFLRLLSVPSNSFYIIPKPNNSKKKLKSSPIFVFAVFSSQLTIFLHVACDSIFSYYWNAWR